MDSEHRQQKVTRRIGRALLWLVVVLLALAVAGAVYQAVATGRAERAYPPPGEMVGVGGHSLHIDCAGRQRLFPVGNLCRGAPRRARS